MLDSEVEYRTLFDTMVDGIFYQLADGCLIDVNPAALEMFGLNRDEFLGRTSEHQAWKVIQPDGTPFLPQHHPSMVALKTGKPVYNAVAGVFNQRLDRFIWLEINALPQFHPGDNAPFQVMVTLHDISARKEAEDRLQEQEEHYRTLFAAITDALFVHGLREDGLPDKFLEINEVACERLGYTRDELLTMSPLDIDAPDSGLDLRPITRKVLAGERVTFQQTHIAKDGRRIAVEISAQRLQLHGRSAVLSLARDINERKQAEQALRQSKERYRLLTELSPDAVTIADCSGIICMVNRRALAIYGHEHESEVIGRSCFEWVADSDQEPAAEALRELIRDGACRVELNLRRKDGFLFRGEINASLLSDSSGHPREIILITTDLTPRLLVEAERLKLQKLEAVGRLAGGIAHDFNNLLQGVFGYLSLAKRNLEEHPNLAKEMLDQADEALSMSINLTTQLLTFAKGGKPVRKNFAVGRVIENAAKFALAGSPCDLKLSIAKDLPPVKADEGQIGQAIQNIVLNANEAMPAGGTIQVSAEKAELAPGEIASLENGGGFIKISIRDAGIGIPDKYLSKIFDPYFTTKQKGSGLGLASSFSIIKNHDGAIEVTSKLNEGSHFSIYLPAASSIEGQENQATAVPAGNRKGRILIMDDEKMVRDLAMKMVQSIGHEAHGACDGAEALEKFIQARQEGNPYDVVILDLTVKGGMGGETAIRRIRKICPDVKAIVSSGYADNPVVADFTTYGFSTALSKPYRLEALRDCLNRLLSEP